MVEGYSLSIPQIHQPRNNRPGFVIIFMFSPIRLFDNPKDLTPSVDMFNPNAHFREFPVVLLFLLCQFPVSGLFDGVKLFG